MAFGFVKEIKIPAAKVPGTGSDSDFIFLFSGTYVGVLDLRTVANGGDVQSNSGYDIAFSTDGVNADLDFELYKYVPTTGEVLFWVRIPTLNYGVDNTLYILYGDSGITTNQSTTATWQSYVSVHHLGDAAYGSGFTPGTANAYLDSSGNHFNGTSSWFTNSRRSTNRVFGDYSTDFNISNGDSTTLTGLGTGMSEDTVTWAEYFDGATGDQELSAFNSDFSKYTYTAQNNQLVNHDLDYNGQQTAPSEYAINHDPGTDDYFFEMSISSAIKKNRLRTFLRSSNITDYRQNSYEFDYIIDVDANHTLTLYKWTSGSKSGALASKTWGAGAIGINVPFTCRFEVKGSVITARVYDGQWFTYTDGSPLSGRYSGFEFLRNTADTGSWIDNMKIGTISDIASSQITIQTWIRPENNSCVWVSDTKNTNGQSIYSYLSATNQLYFAWESEDTPGGATIITTANAAPLNTWTLVHLTANGANGRIIANGVSRGTTTGFQTPTRLAGYSVFLGRSGGSPQNFDGQMQEFRVRKNSLSTSFATAEYNNQSDPATFYTVDIVKNPSWEVELTTNSDLITGESPLLNFPILVSMTKDYLKTVGNGGQVQSASGYDIWFEDTVGGLLDFEVEKWDGTTGELVAWIRIPSLPDTSDYTLKLLFGDAAIVSSLENPTGVWDANFIGVYHMAEAAGNRLDSTSLAANATPQGTVNLDTSGAVNGQADLVGENSRLAVTTSPTFGGAFTFEGWVTFDTLLTNTYFGGRVTNTVENNFRIFTATPGASDRFRFFWRENAGGTETGIQGNLRTINTAQRYYIVGTYDGTDMNLYVDGAVDATPVTNAGLTVRHSTDPFYIGGDDSFPVPGYPSPLNELDGKVDEWRFSNVARSAGWISTTYENITDPSAFLTETVPTPAGYAYTAYATIDNTKVAGTSHTDFPFLFSGTYAWLADTGNGGLLENSNGYDLVFSDGDGNLLDFEIEKYDNTTGEVVIWVRIPTLSGSADTNVYYHYGNSSITTFQGNVNGTWNSDFNAVYHMGEASSTNRLDSTSNGADLTQIGGVVQTAGKIADATQFDSITPTYLRRGDSGDLEGGSAFTITAWMTPVNIDNNNNHILTKYDTAGGATKASYIFKWTAGVATHTISATVNRTGNSTQNETFSENFTWEAGTSYHMGLTFDGSAQELRLFVNGSQIGTTKTTIATAVFDTTSNPAVSAIDQGGLYTQNSDQKIDELKFSTVVRSPDWILTEYNNQSDPNAFYTLVDENSPSYGYTYSAYFEVDPTKVFGSDHTDFPVPFHGDYYWLADTGNGGFLTNSNGYDLIFTDETGYVQYDHEIEDYNNVSGKLAFWVRVPNLSDTLPTKVYYHYGNSSVTTSQENATGVWDSNFLAVYHLNDPGSTFIDSTGVRNGLAEGGTTRVGSGVVGGETQLDNENSRIAISNPMSFGSSFSFSGFIYLNTIADFTYFLGRVINLSDNNFYATTNTVASGSLYWVFKATDLNQYGRGVPTGLITTGQLYHVAGYYDGTTQSTLLNGIEYTPISRPGLTSLDSPDDMHIGGNDTYPAPGYPSPLNELDGNVDEWRFSDSGRTAGWFQTEYASMSASFYTVYDPNGPVVPSTAWRIFGDEGLVS